MENLITTDRMDYSQKTIYQTKLHWISYITPTIYTVIGSIGILPLFITKGTFQLVALLLVILFCKGIIKIWKNKTSKIYISNGFLTISTGIFSKTILDLSLQKMEGMQLYQTWIGKTFNYGILRISTGEISQFYSIKNPNELREKIINQYEKF